MAELTSTPSRSSGARLPRIALLAGDPNGIGPEMLVKLVDRVRGTIDARLLLVASAAALQAGGAVAQRRIEPPSIGLAPVSPGGGLPRPLDAWARADGARGDLAWLEMADPHAADIEPGQMTAKAGLHVLDSLALAARLAREHLVDGVVFAPLNKGAMRLAGLVAEDEMRHLQQLLGVDDFVCEFNVTGELWTSRVTSHIPLAKVASAIDERGVRDAIAIIDRYLRATGMAAPRIAVAGLNPHAGDGGTMGDEEIRIIGPAVKRMQAEGIDARGPLPADTIFVAARRGDFDAVVSMYHDQGQIAMKLLGFDSGVTVLGGLPVPFTTCASGTAFDIVGRGVANIEGLAHALDINRRMIG